MSLHNITPMIYFTDKQLGGTHMSNISGLPPVEGPNEPNASSIARMTYATNLPEKTTPSTPAEVSQKLPPNLQSFEGQRLYFGTQALSLAGIYQKLQGG
jgi:hypothetical protein